MQSKLHLTSLLKTLIPKKEPLIAIEDYMQLVRSLSLMSEEQGRKFIQINAISLAKCAANVF